MLHGSIANIRMISEASSTLSQTYYSPILVTTASTATVQQARAQHTHARNPMPVPMDVWYDSNACVSERDKTPTVRTEGDATVRIGRKHSRYHVRKTLIAPIAIAIAIANEAGILC